MNNDPIVASVRRVREELAAKFNYDVHAIFSDMRSRESQVGGRLVRQPERPNNAMQPTGMGERVFPANEVNRAHSGG